MAVGGNTLLTGTAVRSYDTLKPMQLVSGSDIQLAARKLMVSGSMHVNGALEVHSPLISIGSRKWNSAIGLNTAGGQIQMGGAMAIDHTTIRNDATVKAMVLRSAAGIRLGGHSAPTLSLAADKVSVEGHEQISLSSNTIRLAAGLNSPIVLDAQQVQFGGLSLRGAALTAPDATKHTTVRSSAAVSLRSKAVLISGSQLSLAARDQAVLKAHSVEIAADWGGSVTAAVTGGALTTDGISLTGSTLSSSRDPVKPLQIESGSGGIVFRDPVHVHGSLQVVDSPRVHLSAADINMEAGRITMSGQISANGLEIDGSTLRSDELTKPLTVTSSSRMQLTAEQTLVAGGSIRMQSEENILLSARQSIRLQSGLNEPIVLDGATEIGGLLLGGESLQSIDEVTAAVYT